MMTECSKYIAAAAVAVGMSAACGVGIFIGSIPERVYLVPSTSIDAAATGEMIEMEKARVIRILAWTNGGADVDFGSIDCLYGVSGAVKGLLNVGDVIHLRARLSNVNPSRRISFACEAIGEKNQ